MNLTVQTLLFFLLILSVPSLANDYIDSKKQKNRHLQAIRRIPKLFRKPPTTPMPFCKPIQRPTQEPTDNPTYQPTHNPSSNPTNNPTDQPTNNPTHQPTHNPTHNPTQQDDECTSSVSEADTLIACEYINAPDLKRCSYAKTIYLRSKDYIPTQIGLLTQVTSLSFKNSNGSLPSTIGCLTNGFPVFFMKIN
jgi:PT repeat